MIEKILAYYVTVLIVLGMLFVSFIVGILNYWLFFVAFLAQCGLFLYLAHKGKFEIIVRLREENGENKD